MQTSGRTQSVSVVLHGHEAPHVRAGRGALLDGRRRRGGRRSSPPRPRPGPASWCTGPPSPGTGRPVASCSIRPRRRSRSCRGRSPRSPGPVWVVAGVVLTTEPGTPPSGTLSTNLLKVRAWCPRPSTCRPGGCRRGRSAAGRACACTARPRSPLTPGRCRPRWCRRCRSTHGPSPRSRSPASSMPSTRCCWRCRLRRLRPWVRVGRSVGGEVHRARGVGQHPDPDRPAGQCHLVGGQPAARGVQRRRAGRVVVDAGQDELERGGSGLDEGAGVHGRGHLVAGVAAARPRVAVGGEASNGCASLGSDLDWDALR